MSNKRVKNERNNIMERLYLAANLVHIEMHIMDTISQNKFNTNVSSNTLNKLLAYAKEIRNRRRNVMLDIDRSLNKKGLIEGNWCTIKHILTSIIHTMEVLEQDCNYELYIELLQYMIHLLDDLLSDINMSNLVSCPRCDNDMQTSGGKDNG